jgi:prepilin-type N-terminal cleavage/methylation domain-containing protein
MRARRPRGFTLMETIIAVVILSLAVPTMFWAIRDSQTKRANPVMVSRARWLATEKIEDVIADRHSTTRGYAYVLTSNYPAEASTTGFAGFTRTTAIAETAADLVSAGTGFKKVTVTVGFTDAAGVARTLSLATVVTDYTP